MRILTNTNSMNAIRNNSNDLIKGNVPKLAAKQIDNVEDINFKGTKENHRVSFQYNKDLGRNISCVIDNSTGKTVKQLPSETQVDHMIRMDRLMGLNVDEEA